jgi:tetratricopeptide (TPR) repeat protein
MENNGSFPKVSARLAAFVLILASALILHAGPLEDARSRFNDREFDKAAALFEEASSTSLPSAGVFYELGRTYSELGNEPRAALNFERALLLDARFAPARTALRKTLTDLGIPQQPADWKTTVAERIPMDPLAIAATITFWLAAFLFLDSAFSKKKLVRVLSAFAVLIVSGSLFATVWLCDPRIAARDAAMVLTIGGTSVLSSPADQSEKVASLPQGAVITILSQRGRWFYATLPGGKKGWVLTEGIVPLIPAS